MQALSTATQSKLGALARSAGAARAHAAEFNLQRARAQQALKWFNDLNDMKKLRLVFAFLLRASNGRPLGRIAASRCISALIIKIIRSVMLRRISGIETTTIITLYTRGLRMSTRQPEDRDIKGSKAPICLLLWHDGNLLISFFRFHIVSISTFFRCGRDRFFCVRRWMHKIRKCKRGASDEWAFCCMLAKGRAGRERERERSPE